MFPSLIENSPNILLEAMAYGAPVLAGKHDPMPEFGGSAVRYFDAFDSTAIAREISAALADEPGLAQMREAARARAQHYSWDVFTKHVIALYAKGTFPLDG